MEVPARPIPAPDPDPDPNPSPDPDQVLLYALRQLRDGDEARLCQLLPLLAPLGTQLEAQADLVNPNPSPKPHPDPNPLTLFTLALTL